MNIFIHLIKQFIKENKLNVLFVIVLSFIIILIQINVLSLITANIIQSIQGKNKNILYNNYKIFLGVLFFYIVVFILYRHLQNILMIKLRGWTKTELFRIILTINNTEYNDTDFINLDSGMHKYSGIFFNVFSNIISFLLPNISLLLIVSIYFMIKDYKFGLIFLLCNIIIICFLYYKWDDIVKLYKEYEFSQYETNNLQLDNLNNFDKIIYRNQYLVEVDNFKNSIDSSIEVGNVFFNYISKIILIINIIIYIFIGILVYYLIQMYYSNVINITIFITFFTIILLYRDRILLIIQQLPDYIENFSKENSIHKYLNDINFNINKINNLKFKKCDIDFDTIEFKNVVFKYKKSKNIIFNGLNIKLNLNNKIIGITGLSGHGKSTFVKLIIKMYNYKGDIFIDDINIQNIDNTCIRNNIVYVNQTSKLFNQNVDYNIYYGIKNKELVKEYIDEIYQFEKIKQLLSNIDMKENVGTNGENLSGGQRQIINIINGLIIPSKILIIDEPTNALDPQLKKDVISLIKYFKKYKKCIIIISHDKDIYPIFNETINI